MSQPNLPNITPAITLSRDDAINLIISSIAMEEMGLSHIINTEGEKHALGTKYVDQKKNQNSRAKKLQKRGLGIGGEQQADRIQHDLCGLIDRLTELGPETALKGEAVAILRRGYQNLVASITSAVVNADCHEEYCGGKGTDHNVCGVMPSVNGAFGDIKVLARHCQSVDNKNRNSDQRKKPSGEFLGDHRVECFIHKVISGSVSGSSHNRCGGVYIGKTAVVENAYKNMP